METQRLAAAAWEEQDAGSGPVPNSPMLGPMTGAIHNISARHLHDIGTSMPDDRQFLRAWRRSLQDVLAQQNSRIVQFLLADVSGSSSAAESDIQRRCTDVLNKYSKPTWNFASSTRDLSLPSSTTDAAAAIEQEIGVSPTVLRDQMRKAIRLYANTASALSTAEMRLEEKLRRLETLVAKVNDLMFMEPTAELEAMSEPARTYLDSVIDKISIEDEYREVIEQQKRFVVLKGLVSLGSFQRQTGPTCTICMTKEVSHTITPCGHTFCDECCRSQMTACFICRVQIRDRLRLYFS
jgi:Zinc finger, C3HC4 type (RING finger)